jgi:serine O-acetyltransferase
VLAEVGDFNEALTDGEDRDLWLRILRSGYRAARIPGVHGVECGHRSPPGPVARAPMLALGLRRTKDALAGPIPAELSELLDYLGLPGGAGAADLATSRSLLRAQAWESWRRDRARYPASAWLTQRSLWAVATFRLGQAINACPRPLRLLLAPVHHTLTLLVRIMTGIEIAGGATIGPGLRIFHAGAIIVNPGARLGSDCTLNMGVIIGNRDSAVAPVIGDRVTISAGSFVLGAVDVGDNAVVGAMSLVLDDVPAGAIVAGVPARVIRERPGLAG